MQLTLNTFPKNSLGERLCVYNLCQNILLLNLRNDTYKQTNIWEMLYLSLYSTTNSVKMSQRSKDHCCPCTQPLLRCISYTGPSNRAVRFSSAQRSQNGCPQYSGEMCTENISQVLKHYLTQVTAMLRSSDDQNITLFFLQTSSYIGL